MTPEQQLRFDLVRLLFASNMLVEDVLRAASLFEEWIREGTQKPPCSTDDIESASTAV